VFNEEKVKSTGKTPNGMEQEPNFIIRHNVRSRSIRGVIREFEENEAFRLVRRKDSVRLFHTILSFSKEDTPNISDKLLKDIASKFIVERGNNNLYVGTKHDDRDRHVHLHIIVSGTQLNGRSSRISKQQFHHLKLELDRYQREKYPQLVHSLPEHERSNRGLKKEIVLEELKANRETQKEKLCTILESAYNGSCSIDQFLNRLASSGYGHYYRNGKLQGVVWEGQKFRFSRLGYNEATLQSLEQQSRTLDDLNRLRESKDRELVKPVERPVLEREDDVGHLQTSENERKLLDELSALRGSQPEKVIEYDLEALETSQNNGQDLLRKARGQKTRDELSIENY
jgi:hypothetical protein